LIEGIVMKVYCGDCVNLQLKRDKYGVVTGEHVCISWNNQLRSEWQSLDCSFFFDKQLALRSKRDGE